MKLIICENYDEVMEQAAQITIGIIKNKPNCVLGLPTGSTPIGLYNNLAKEYAAGKLDFSQVKSFNLDEYYPISPDNDQSYRYFMNKHLFSRINIDINNTRVPNGNSEDPHKECDEYEKAITAAGGIDLQILGIGNNGHIGFNEPDENLIAHTHMTKLTDNTIEANSRFFEKPGDVPRRALTMGMASIMKARKILMIVTGRAKHKALMTMLSENITTNIPASLLKLHPDVTIICDKASYEEKYLGIDIGGTQIKYGVVSDADEIVSIFAEDTDTSSEQALLSQLETIARKMMELYNIQGIGIGLPGHVSTRTGRVGLCVNLPFDNTDVEGYLSKSLGISVRIAKDANCAVIAEHFAGIGRQFDNIMTITLGTGVGGGLILNNALYTGTNENGAEIGHIITHASGRKCGCGQQGCFEQYGSVTALIEETRKAVATNPGSILANCANNELNGKTVFTAVDAGCPVAAKVLDNWLEEISLGIKSLAQIFSPDIVVLTGAIMNDAEKIIPALSAKCSGVKIVRSHLKSSAGIVGAAMLQYKNIK